MYLKCIKNDKHTMNVLFTGRFAETCCPKFLSHLPISVGIWENSCVFVISTNKRNSLHHHSLIYLTVRLPRPADKRKQIRLHARLRTIISGYGRN